MRIRGKISFEAFVQIKTIPELMIKQIYNTSNDLVSLNEILLPYEYLIIEDSDIIDKLLARTMTNLLRELFRMNNELLMIREYLATKVDKKKAVYFLYQQRKGLT